MNGRCACSALQCSVLRARAALALCACSVLLRFAHTRAAARTLGLGLVLRLAPWHVPLQFVATRREWRWKLAISRKKRAAIGQLAGA